MWVVSEPYVDQSSQVETYIIPNDNVVGLLWSLFLWGDEDIGWVHQGRLAKGQCCRDPVEHGDGWPHGDQWLRTWSPTQARDMHDVPPPPPGPGPVEPCPWQWICIHVEQRWHQVQTLSEKEKMTDNRPTYRTSYRPTYRTSYRSTYRTSYRPTYRTSYMPTYRTSYRPTYRTSQL